MQFHTNEQSLIEDLDLEMREGSTTDRGKGTGRWLATSVVHDTMGWNPAAPTRGARRTAHVTRSGEGAPTRGARRPRWRISDSERSRGPRLGVPKKIKDDCPSETRDVSSRSRYSDESCGGTRELDSGAPAPRRLLVEWEHCTGLP
jgi:hypothetical protein